MKKFEIKKIENTIPYDAFISHIDGIIGNVKNVNLEVYFTSKKIYEIEDTMFILLDIFDNSSDMKALLIGNRNQHFISMIDNIKYGLKYRISGDVYTLDSEDIDVELSFLNKIKNNKVFCIYALQCYSDTIYGIDINKFNGCIDVKEEYEVISKYTNYLQNISLDQVKDIKSSCYNEIVVLLNNGTLFVNGEKKSENIDMIYYINSHTICAIGVDNTITCITKNGVSGINFLNNHDYRYKKILVTEFGIVALTGESIVVYFGDMVSSLIDISRFTNIDDIFLDDEGNVMVSKGNTTYSLFHNGD